MLTKILMIMMYRLEWLDKILAKEEIYNPIIIGQSMGGYLAQMYMELYPDKIRCV